MLRTYTFSHGLILDLTKINHFQRTQINFCTTDHTIILIVLNIPNVYQVLYRNYNILTYLTYMKSTSWETLNGGSTSWNQDCPEKYQWPQICRWHHPYGRKWRTKEPLDESERGEWKVGLMLNIQKIKIVASGPITSWQIDGEIVETVADFFFSGLQSHCRWWLQPCI